MTNQTTLSMDTLFNLLMTLPAELRNMTYDEALADDLNAPLVFNNGVRNASLPIPDLARNCPARRREDEPDLLAEVLSWYYGGMYAEMDIRDNSRFWLFWARFTATDAFLVDMRKFEILGPIACPGVGHAKIFINLKNPNDPVICGGQVRGRNLAKDRCKTVYMAAAKKIEEIIKRDYQGGRLNLTTRKLVEIFKVVADIKPEGDDEDDEDGEAGDSVW